MKLLAVGLFLVLSLASAQADQAIANAQQSLKDQGFYFGQITGEKSTETGASLRRYQIRNGLEVTGELNDETIQALRKAPRQAVAPVAAATAAPSSRAEPAPSRAQAEIPDRQGENGGDHAAAGSIPSPPRNAPPMNRAGPVLEVERTGPAVEASFQGTPFETASPEMQRKVVMGAQRTLAHKGLFNYPINGVLGPEMEFSLRAYQSRVGLRLSGRLDLETLAALELLPGARERVYNPRRSYPAALEPPVRGEWIRP